MMRAARWSRFDNRRYAMTLGKKWKNIQEGSEKDTVKQDR